MRIVGAARVADFAPAAVRLLDVMPKAFRGEAARSYRACAAWVTKRAFSAAPIRPSFTASWAAPATQLT